MILTYMLRGQHLTLRLVLELRLSDVLLGRIHHLRLNVSPPIVQGELALGDLDDDITVHVLTCLDVLCTLGGVDDDSLLLAARAHDLGWHGGVGVIGCRLVSKSLFFTLHEHCRPLCGHVLRRLLRLEVEILDLLL